MIIREIELKNIRSHEHTKIDLGSGTYLIEGDIGSGKSSILMAVEFALFGNSTPKFYQRLLRKGTTEAYVRIKFEHGGKSYEIYRSLKKKTDGGISKDKNYIIEDGVKKDLSSGEIQQKFMEVLGIPYSSRAKSLPIVTYAIYTPQEAMKSILTGRADERMEIIRKIFRLDYYDNAVRNAKIVSTELDKEIGKDEGVKDQIDDNLKEKEELLGKLDELEARRRDLKARRDEILMKLESVKGELERMDRLREEHEKLDKERGIIEETLRQLQKRKSELEREIEELEALEERLKSLQSDAERYESLQREEEGLSEEISKLNDLRREISEKNGLLRTLQESISREKALRDEIEAYEREIRKLESRKADEGDVEKKLSKLQERIDGLNKRYGAYESRKREKEKELEEYRGLTGVCPVCKRPLDEAHKKKLILSVQDEISRISGELSRMESERKELEKEMKSMRAKERELRGIERELARYDTALKKMREDLNDIENKKGLIESVRKEIENIAVQVKPLKEKEERYRSIKEEMKKLSEKYREYHGIKARVARMDEVRKKLEAVVMDSESKHNDLESVKLRLSGLNYDAGAHARVREKWNKLSAEIAETNTNLKNVEGEITEKRDKVRKIEMKVTELEHRLKIAERKESVLNWIGEKFVKQVQEIEKMRLNAINDAFRVLFEKWFYELMGEGDYSATINDAFSPELRYEGYTMPVETLSGGERTSVALAYRLALNAIVKRALSMEGSLLILDEPTDGFSKDQLYKLKDILDKMETEQVIIVSHENELRNLADTIVRVEKINGRSEVRII